MIIEKNAGTSYQKIRKYWKVYDQLGWYFTVIPVRKCKFYPSSAGNIWLSGYVHHRLKRGHPGHKDS